MGLNWEIQCLGTGPKASVSVVQRFGKGPGIVISLVNSILLQVQDRYFIIISYYCSHTTTANAINLYGKLPLQICR